MQTETNTWVNLLISWAPFIILIAFWVYFMKKGFGGKHGKYIERSLAFMDRQEQLLERIAVALEQRNRAVP